MRRFHSYGPVNEKKHFAVPREYLISSCLENLAGDPDEGGHYFTIWAPRQAGKTWLMRQAIKRIPTQYPGKFTLLNFSLGALNEMRFDPSDMHNLPRPFIGLLKEKLPEEPVIKEWEAFRQVFSRKKGLWDRPLILLLDEVDAVPSAFLDLMVAQFRELYLDRENNWLHSLALTGIRAVLGVDSKRGSPFNIQRSLNVPNLTKAETQDLYHQYETESGQKISPDVTDRVYEVTNGQPGLVSWFGELLTEKYNPGQDKIIDIRTWKVVWHNARFTEPNNTVLNIIAKARLPEYRDILMAVFSQTDVPFAFHDPVCNYLYLNGIIKSYTVEDNNEETNEFCRFSSPFIQDCIYSALGMEMIKTMPVRPLDPLDDLSDVLDEPDLNLSALMDRYQDYLKRLKAAGHDIWKDQPLRTDLRIREAPGHFHLHAWLYNAIGRHCAVTPEFPAGNGQVDIHIRCDNKRGIIEVKSFSDLRQINKAKKRSAEYAASLGLNTVVIAVFISDASEEVLNKISSEGVTDGVNVIVRAIGLT